jgi:hypothetical protein
MYLFIMMNGMDRTIRAIGVGVLAGLGIFFFTAASRLALGPTQLHIQWVSVFFPRV